MDGHWLLLVTTGPAGYYWSCWLLLVLLVLLGLGVSVFLFFCLVCHLCGRQPDVSEDKDGLLPPASSGGADQNHLVT